MLYDFIHVLNSAREVYTKKYYFSNSKLFFYNFFTAEKEIKSEKSDSRGFIKKLFCKFWTFLQVSMNF
jgi:hypothetical protein